jgi:hypothetical protein
MSSELNAGAKGVVMMLIDDQGRVAAHGADFLLQGYGGISLREAQEYRARRFLEIAFINTYGGPVIAKVADTFHVEQMVSKLTREHGWRIQTVAIGYPDAAHG